MVFDTVLLFLKKCYNAQGRKFRYLDWKLVAPNEIPLQIDDVSCGVYTCMNAYNAVNLTNSFYNNKDVVKLRYWILSKALVGRNVPFKANDKKSGIRRIEKPVSGLRHVSTSYDTKYSIYLAIKNKLEDKIDPTIQKNEFQSLQDEIQELMEENESDEEMSLSPGISEKVGYSDDAQSPCEVPLLDEEKISKAASCFSRNRIYTNELLNGAYKAALAGTDGWEMRCTRKGFRSIYNKKRKDFLGFQQFDLHKFDTHYCGLTIFLFHEYMVWPELATKWQMEENSTSYRNAEIMLFGSRPFHLYSMFKDKNVQRSVKFENVVIQVVHGDITKERAEAIVNAANGKLMHGGGVAKAIVNAAGEEEEVTKQSPVYVRSNGEVTAGNVAVTDAGKLNAEIILHAVGMLSDANEFSS
eukprot:gene2978-3432_t